MNGDASKLVVVVGFEMLLREAASFGCGSSLVQELRDHVGLGLFRKLWLDRFETSNFVGRKESQLARCE